MLALAIGDHQAHEVVSVLYRSVLGREADGPGAATWVDHLVTGRTPLDVAEALTHSPEFLRRRPDDRREVHADLSAWRTLGAAVELGLVALRLPDDADLDADAIFVAALFEVALHRAPRRDEVDYEVAKLRSGIGRDWLLRAYARPEFRRRFAGVPARKPRAMLAQVRARRRMIETFTSMVVAAESARLAELRAAARAVLAVASTSERTGAAG